MSKCEKCGHEADVVPKRHIPGAYTREYLRGWTEGMERAAGLLDEEAHSAEKVCQEAAAVGNSFAKMRLWHVRDSMQLMARTVRAFKEAGPDGPTDSAPEEHHP